MQEDIRYIENPFKKIVSIIKPDHDKLYSLLFELIQEFIQGSELPTITAVASDPTQTEIDISAYAGANGYLYTLLRIYRFISSKSQQEQKTETLISSSIQGDDQIAGKLKNPTFYLQLALQQYALIKQYILEKKPRRNTLAFLMSETCTWVCGMHLGYSTRNTDLFRENEMRLIECFQFYRHDKGKFMVQLLYGTPGFLYAFLQIQDHYDKIEEEIFRTHFSKISMELTEDIVNSGIQTYEQMTKNRIDVKSLLDQPEKVVLPENFRLMYLFHKKEYLGGAHGLGGNLNIILLSMRLNNFEHNKVIMYCALMSRSISFLLKHLINGNFSTSAGSQRIKLVHFCHGAPGIISCLARFLLVFPEQSIKLGLEAVIQKSLEHVWEYGVLKKGFGLCHGISGNAYAFIAPSVQEALPQLKSQYLNKANLFALLRYEKQVMKEIKTFHFSDRYVVGKSDNPYSMMLGVAGDICFTIDVIQGTGRFPGFDF